MQKTSMKNGEFALEVDEICLTLEVWFGDVSIEVVKFWEGSQQYETYSQACRYADAILDRTTCTPRQAWNTAIAGLANANHDKLAHRYPGYYAAKAEFNDLMALQDADERKTLGNY